MEKYYITTAIAYASKKPHFGNTYEAIMTDALTRYRRERGYDVFMCTSRPSMYRYSRGYHEHC